MVIPENVQLSLGYNEYMTYNKGITGNPNHFIDLHTVHFPADIYGDIPPMEGRAWWVLNWFHFIIIVCT